MYIRYVHNYDTGWQLIACSLPNKHLTNHDFTNDISTWFQTVITPLGLATHVLMMDIGREPGLLNVRIILMRCS